jgi:threonine aldolase
VSNFCFCSSAFTFIAILNDTKVCIYHGFFMTYMTDKFPQCSSGGRCLSVEYTDRVGEVAKKHGLKLHIDGARIFNASVVSQFVFYL